MTPIQLTHDDYTVGWICPLALEMAAAQMVLDNVYGSLSKPRGDQNTNIQFGLLVGIGGGVPSSSNDIRLGDIVVSEPSGTLAGAVQYNMGKLIEEGKLERLGSQNYPPRVLLSAINQLQANHMIPGARGRKLWTYIEEIFKSIKNEDEDSPFLYPGKEKDLLFRADYRHVAAGFDCQSCDKTYTIPRKPRSSYLPRGHYGIIGSADQVMKDGSTRDRVAKELGVICFEMEAAGLMNIFPCLVVRGICGYADSHKRKEWQFFAALVAAAYGKELLSVVSPDDSMTPGVSKADKLHVKFSSEHTLSKHFIVGRENELDELERLLGYTTSHHTVTLTGLGGIDPHAHDLVEDLDGVPLAIASAGAYLSHKRTLSCSEWRDLYKENWLRLQEQAPGPFLQWKDPATHWSILQATWSISLIGIKKGSSLSFAILCLWACLGSHDLWFELVQDAKEIGLLFQDTRKLDKLVFEEEMAYICEYGFVQIASEPIENKSGTRGYEMNRCVHSWLFHEVISRLDRVFEVFALECVITHALKFDDYQQQAICNRMLPTSYKC
ncbi:hypothetical protein N7493_007356 [Penicillium malachiteum]|uniref:Nucleoside phosphorylase domain-containing protein n=1 Tax=Penicillium malachiteum TaxID=1324776 RepID=A0AAD6HJ71_9EURO|nr:hypothetical protein N7493_007356 [Penicillium malachiteum]